MPEDHPTSALSLGDPPLDRLAAGVLSRFVGGDMAAHDAGPMILAALAAGRGAVSPATVEEVAAAWIERLGAPRGLGLYHGLGTLVLGLGVAAPHSARLAAMHARIRATVLDRVSEMAFTIPAVDWPDYDLITGPAGGVLALCADGEADADRLRPLTDHLAALLASANMDGFRIVGCRGDPQRGWNTGTVNLGLAHGVGGPIAALTAILRRRGGPASPLAPALARAADWTLAQAHHDTRGLHTWPPHPRPPQTGPAPASRREAWCYGAPGMSWTLWDAGTALGRADIATAALDAFRAFARTFDPGFHLDDDPAEALAICHGAAGILLVADAFARHAGSPEARHLAQRLDRLLADRLDEVSRLSDTDCSLVSGASGILAALLVRQGGDRGWLTALALR